MVELETSYRRLCWFGCHAAPFIYTRDWLSAGSTTVQKVKVRELCLVTTYTPLLTQAVATPSQKHEKYGKTFVS